MSKVRKPAPLLIVDDGGSSSSPSQHAGLTSWQQNQFEPNSNRTGAVESASSTGTCSTENHPTADSAAALYANLETLRQLGRGCSSRVFLARHKENPAELYAVKRINIYDKDIRMMLLQEMETFMFADCECLVRFFGATYNNDGCVSVILEYCDAGSLDSVLARSPKTVAEGALAGIAYQCLYGLAYLAFEQRVHRDIKPSNILVNSDGTVKLTDFGISRSLADSIAKTFIGSIRYMSPERVSHEAYDTQSDIWALGICLLEAAIGHYPFAESSHVALVMCLTEGPPPMPPKGGEYSNAFIDFLEHSVARQPSVRWSAVELLDHPWFAEQRIDGVESAAANVKAWLDALPPKHAAHTSQLPAAGV